ncbi:MAG: hypothetical protein GY808_13155, partial [Gammaproteobacteria bacterium]|nr:hypothetical protein [Gammaproteobacteria bacterium]
YPGGDFGALKLEAKDESGAVLASIETIGVGITTDWQLFSTSLIMPEGTATVTPVLVATKWSGDGKTAAYGFDNVVLLDLGVSDLEPPIAPTGVLASSDAENFFNLVVWQDVDGESDETYSVYASTNPITNVDDPGVELLASGVKEEVKQVIHYLFYPLHDQEVTYYYAVACTDRAGNTGPAGNAGSATVNTAKAVPTISLDVPATFAADGDLSEWDDSDITPFEMSPETHYVVGGAVTDAADLSATVYLAVDDDFLYIAADVIDDVYHFSAGNWWEKDAFECFIGLYDSRSGKHNTYKGADEPDYKLFMTENNLSRDPG